MLRIPCGRIELLLQRHSAEKSLPDMLFLHGFMGNGCTFGPLIRELYSTVNAITLDISAAASENQVWSGEPLFTPGTLSKALHQIPGDLFFGRPIIYAYSMGGRIALHEASSGNHLFNQAPALLLESTTAGIEDATQRKLRRLKDCARARSLLADFDRFVQEWQNQPLFRAGNTINNSISRATMARDYPGSSNAGEGSAKAGIRRTHEEYAGLQRRIDPNEAARWLLDFGTGSMPSLWNQLEKIHPPALLITGEHDHRFTRKAQRMQQHLHTSTHVIIPAASHRTHSDEPGILACYIAHYINNLEPGSPRFS